MNCCHANQDTFWVEDPDGVEWEVYVLNHDIDEDPADVRAGCVLQAAPSTAKSALTVVKGTSCCSA